MARRRREPRWLTRLVLDAVHHDQLREHGGRPGVRDEGLLESALARPQQKWHYSKPDLAALAAAYAFGLAKNHPYTDGNKRIAFLAMVTFIELHAHAVDAQDVEVVDTKLALAAGRLSEDELADWVRAHTSRFR